MWAGVRTVLSQAAEFETRAVRDHPQGKTIAFSCCLLPSGVGMLRAMAEGGTVRIALRAASLKIEDAAVLFSTE